MRARSWSAWILWAVAVAAMLLLGVALLSGCGSGPSAAACKSALRAEYAAAVTSGAKGSEPSACKGLPADQIRKLVGQVISEQLGGAQ